METTSPDNGYRGWSTQAEIDFVYRLAAGKHAIVKLCGYIDGMARRTEFGSIDAEAVLTVAREKLAHLRSVAA